MIVDKSLIISLTHILIFGPLLVIIGNSYGMNLNQNMFTAILLTGIAMFLYHLYLVYMKGVSSGFIYVLHMAIFAPVLIYVGYYKDKAFWGAYSVLTMIGFASIGYHGLKVYKKLM